MNESRWPLHVCVCLCVCICVYVCACVRELEEILSLPRRLVRRLLGVEVGNFGLLIEPTAGITKFGFQALDVGAGFFPFLLGQLA